MSETKEMADLLSKHLAEPIKEKFKTLMAAFQAEKMEDTPAATETYNEAQLADGTILKYTGDLAVGAKCLLVTPEGEVPAPEGDIVLADGSTVVIKKEGEDSVIAEIKPVEMKEQPLAAEVQKAIDEAVNAKFSALEKENKSLKADLEATKLKLSKKSSQLIDLGTVVEAMASVTPKDETNKSTVNTNKPERLSKRVESRF